jgi:hypothetical protein
MGRPVIRAAEEAAAPAEEGEDAYDPAYDEEDNAA